MEKLEMILKKILTKEVMFYIIFGILTTIINIAISYILKTIFKIEGNIASTIGILCSILFAYFTNRKFVFNSKANSFKEKTIELGKFILGRIVTMIIEVAGIFLLNDILRLFYNSFSENMAYLTNKCLITVIVIILNFFISKFFAFESENNKK